MDHKVLEHTCTVYIHCKRFNICVPPAELQGRFCFLNTKDESVLAAYKTEMVFHYLLALHTLYLYTSFASGIKPIRTDQLKLNLDPGLQV